MLPVAVVVVVDIKPELEVMEVTETALVQVV
jgi:hypothetical protein